MKRRFLSAVLALIMLFSLIPVGAFEADAATALLWPVPGHYQLKRGYSSGHQAIDITDGKVNGAVIIAACGGTVTKISNCGKEHYGSYGDCGGTGTGVVIKGNDGKFYSYAHMQAGSIPANIKKGAKVAAGTVLGKVGTTGNSSGPHLHFSIAKGKNYLDNRINPMNTANFTFNKSITAPEWINAPKVATKNVDNGIQVTLSTSNSGATIYYTTNGSAPTTSSTKYTGPFVTGKSVKVRAIAVKNSLYSPEVSKQVTITKTLTPVITADVSANGFNVSISAEQGAIVYYTLDGSNPTTSSLRYNGNFTVSESTTIKAIAIKTGKTSSAVATSTCSAVVPNAPKVSLDASSSATMGIGQSICVKWAEVDNAYEYEYTVTRGGETVISETTQNTMATYTPTEDGTYEVTVKAVNFMGQSQPSSPAIRVVVKPNVMVQFQDHDGTVISAQSISYGGNAIAPAAPSRVGHTFTKWSGSYMNVKKDATITAVYVADTYTIKFLDGEGNTLATETVAYGNSVTTVPTAPERTGYTFTAWSVKSGEGSSYTSVNGNAVFEPAYTWTDPDMPVAVAIQRATRNSDASGYTIQVQAVNLTDETVHGKLITVIKTGSDKVVATKIDTISIPANATEYAKTVDLGATAVGSIAEVYVVANDKENDNRTGGAYSNKAHAEVTQESSATTSYWTEWGEWSETAVEPNATMEVETRMEYRYRDKETTTSTSSAMDGWTQTGSSVSYGAWGSWSGWSTTKQTASSTKDVGTRTVHVYKHYCNGSGDIAPSTAYTNGKYGPHIIYSTTKYAVSRTSSTGYTITDNLTKCAKGATGYYYFGTATQYRYRTRTQTTNYSFYRWGEYSDWSEAAVTESETRQVEVRTVYRYRTLETVTTTEDTPFLGAEDTSGTRYTIEGKLDAVTTDYSDKTAIIMVYKNRNVDPTEDQIEYVGQIKLGTGNSYSFSFVPREEISEETGDYIVSFGIATADGLVNNVEIIEAPKPSYNVVFMDTDGNIISNQTVIQGEDAVAPDMPVVEGHRVMWDRSFTNITKPTQVRAIAEPKTYSVIFVDWANNQVVSIDELTYGEPIVFPEDCSAEGKNFIGWSVPENAVVTGTTVVESIYEDVQFTATFLNQDGTIFAVQQVHYGDAVVLPEETPGAEGYTFVAWSNESNWWNVTENVEIKPVFIFDETAETPVINTNEDDGIKVDFNYFDLETSTENAQIHYTLDGSEPTEDDPVFSEMVWVEETVVVKAKAFCSGMNPSETVEFTVEVTPASAMPTTSIMSDHEKFTAGVDTASVPMRIDNPNGYAITGYGIIMTPEGGGEPVSYWKDLDESRTDAALGVVISVSGLAQDTTYSCVTMVSFVEIELVESEPAILTTGSDHEHVYTSETVASNCMEQGYTEHTCTTCGKVRRDNYVPLAAHTYESGICTVCHMAELFNIAFAQAELGNALSMRFAFAADGYDDWEGAYAVATKVYADGRDDVVETIPVEEWTNTVINGEAYYYFSFNNISGKEMTDDITVVIYNSYDVPISNPYSESIRSYIMRALQTQTNAKVLTLMVDMLNYGATAQNYFGYGTDDLANSLLSDEQKALGTRTSPAVSDNRVKGDNYLGTRLELKSSIIMCMAFKGMTIDMTAKIEYTNHRGVLVSELVHPENVNGTVMVVIDQIVVADGRQNVTVTVYNADGSVYGSASDSMESYLSRVGTDDLYNAIMIFSDSAYAYLHRND